MDKTSAYGPKVASKVCKYTQAGGFFSLAISFAMLGPLKLGALSFFGAFDNIPSVWIGMLFKGIGSAGNNAGYPDLAIGISDTDSMKQATLAGLWVIRGVTFLGHFFYAGCGPENR